MVRISSDESVSGAIRGGVNTVHSSGAYRHCISFSDLLLPAAVTEEDEDEGKSKEDRFPNEIEPDFPVKELLFPFAALSFDLSSLRLAASMKAESIAFVEAEVEKLKSASTTTSLNWKT
jgi:hypothetical protein